MVFISHHSPAPSSSHCRRFQLVQTLFQMPRTRGHGFFVVFPDLLSHDLPSVCFRKLHGLLSRVSESNQSARRTFDATRLYASREGESIEECSSSVKNLDSVTVSEAFVENFDRFAEAMDGVSNGGFLRGEESELGSDWIELEWLKAKGYYSIEAFVALRLAWMNSGNGRKRGVKLKEKATVAGVAANVFWSKKGCIDWWGNLDASSRRKVFNTMLGKAAAPLTHEILKGTSIALEDEILLFNTGAELPLRRSARWRSPRAAIIPNFHLQCVALK